MQTPESTGANSHPPRLPLALLRAWLPFAERDEVISELTAEYRARASEDGRGAARAWLWRQVLGSLPPLLRRTFSRGWTGFEPASSQLRPGGPRMESWIMDLRYAARRLRSRPTYLLLTVLTLALGVGGTAAAFGLVRGLLLEPLPYPNEDRLVQLWFEGAWSERELLHLGGDWPGFEDVGGIRAPRDLPMRRAGEATARLVPSVRATSNLFDVLGVHAQVGRTFDPSEGKPGGGDVVVLSDALYRELGGAPSLVGNTLELDGRPHTIVGVAPPRFWYPDPTVRAWVAEPLDDSDGSGNYLLIGRLKPGVGGAQLEVALGQIGARLEESFDYPDAWDKTKSPSVRPLREALLGPLQTPLLATLAAMGVLLLIACANVAALMLGQVDGRATELAVRVALGADSRRVRQQLVAEALLIGAGSAAVGALVAVQGHRLLREALPLGRLAPPGQLDWSVFVMALSLAMVAALGIAWFPARSAKRADPQRALAASRTGGVGARGGRTANALVVGQVALAVLMTAGAALLVRSVSRLSAIDSGVETNRTAVVDTVIEGTVAPEARVRLLNEMEEAVRAIPGVEAAGLTFQLPMRGSNQNWGLRIAHKPGLPVFTTAVRLVTPGYFEAVGIQLRDGRLPARTDHAGTETVVAINEPAARRYFAGEDPVGRRVSTFSPKEEVVVGVVEGVAEAGLTDGSVPARYMLYAQLPEWAGTQHAVVLRAAPGQDPAALLPEARRVLSELSPSIAVQRSTTMAAVLDHAIGPARQVMKVLVLLTVLAVLLGAVGIYGVTSHFVRRRQREIGIQMALGLTPSKVVTGIVRRGGALVGAGALVGVAAAAPLSHLLSSLLYGVSALDPVSLAASILMLLAVGVLAAWVPAWRASRMDPAAVFREA